VGVTTVRRGVIRRLPTHPVVAFDYTAVALLELLRRQLDRTMATPAITAALIVNGGLFAEAHTHPWWTTQLLRHTAGRTLDAFRASSRRHRTDLRTQSVELRIPPGNPGRRSSVNGGSAVSRTADSDIAVGMGH
jgi:hypothetical protein